jgi:hypothetical protein
MKVVEKIVNEDGRINLICEEAKLFGLFKTKKHFIATKEFPKGFWNWKDLSNRSEVDEETAFQLDNKCNNDPLFFGMEDFILYTSFRCPFKQELDTCVFKNIRNLSNLDERAEYIKNLSDKNKKEIYRHHKNCIAEREQWKNQ